MSVKRLNSKSKRPPKENPQADILSKLGLEAFWTRPLSPASMLDISSWSLDNPAPMMPKYLPCAFLQRLWLLSPEARSSRCMAQCSNVSNAQVKEEMISDHNESHCAVNPLDLVTSVYMASDSFLQQEITMHMVQCQFAVPLVLPSINPEQPEQFLLWPFRSVVSKWRTQSHANTKRFFEGDLASTDMPLVSCVKIGQCGVSKSQVLSHLIAEQSHSEMFLHRRMDGGQIHRKLANGLVELGWYLPSGDPQSDIFPVPLVISNLRGDAAVHDKCLTLLCRASSAVVVFCGTLREKDKRLLALWKGTASKLILIDVSQPVEDENDRRVVGFESQNLEEELGLPKASVLSGAGLSEKELAHRLRVSLNDLLPNKIKNVTLEAVGNVAVELGLRLDEGAKCKNARAKVGKVLEGLEEGSAPFSEKQLPLQGVVWSRLAEMEKEECKQRRAGEKINSLLKEEKCNNLLKLRSYRMTTAMKAFTEALFTSDKEERTYFLSWMKLRLRAVQIRTSTSQQQAQDHNIQVIQKKETREEDENFETRTKHNAADEDDSDNDSFLTTSTEEEIKSEFVQKHSSLLEDQVDMNNHADSLNTGVQHIEQTAVNLIVPEAQQNIEPVNFVSSQQRKYSGELNLVLDVSDSNDTTIPDLLNENQITSEPFIAKHHESDSSPLGLEHFLREMGLIFELTHTSPCSGSHNVLRLPSIAADLLLYGIPLEIMDGDACNIPISWLSCVLAEFNRRMHPERLRVRVLANVGVQHAGNSELLCALFGVNVPGIKKRLTKGIYMLPLSIPCELRKEMDCDFLLIVNVEGLCSPQLDKHQVSHIQDNEMATLATGICDVLMHSIASCGGDGFESNLNVMVNALLRTEVSGITPICQFVKQDDGLNCKLQALQLGRVAEILQTRPGNTDTEINCKIGIQAKSSIACVVGPWTKFSFSDQLGEEYSKAVLKLKQNLFGTLKNCNAKSKALGLPEFMARLTAVWEEIKAQSFSISLGNTDVAEAFCMLCTELAQWKKDFMEHAERWFLSATKGTSSENAKTSENGFRIDVLSVLKDEARKEVQTGVCKIRTQLESYLMKDDLHTTYIEVYKPNLMTHLAEFQERVTEEMIDRLESAKENLYSSTQLKHFQTMLERGQESKLNELTETSKLNNHLLEDGQLEEEFEVVWNNELSNFNFRHSETDDITARVTEILKDNLINRGLQKHLKKVVDIGTKKNSSFTVQNDYFGYRTRMKHNEDDNRQQRIEANQIVCNVTKDYNRYVVEKSSLLANFSGSYIKEILENVEKALGAKPIDIRSAFEVDLKVYLCSSACKDFQEIHDRYARDRDLVNFINGAKNRHLGEFIYQFRKRDQCQRVAQAFTTKFLKPTALDYVYKPLGRLFMEEMVNQDKTGQYTSPWAFKCSLLEELLEEDSFESFLEYLYSFDTFCLRKIQERVVAHLPKSKGLEKWRRQRLGEVIGKMAVAVSQTAEGVSGVLSDTKLLLEKVCLTLEMEGDLEVSRNSLDGPLFSITTEWDRFVSCLLETLVELRLALAQEFCDLTELLQGLPFKPQDCLFNRVRGCEKQCPFCKAPCDICGVKHEVHQTVLHRPKGMLSYTCADSCSLSHTSCPADIAQDNLFFNKDTESKSLAYKDYRLIYPDWSISPEEPDNQMPGTYWRYVMVRFNERFAEEYERKPANLPKEWENITREDALESLKRMK